ncbi:hypothetical protein AsAng_0020320 [Aureispira anguillae]|uniref:Uncharacterized protein n=1 Tax=Aureispira anguillae TaxID=2864201 RepID=A0A916DSR7_9BACT|nr:hypothetical protein AsAng_0020320 [Aureispira anguillae]
MKISNYFGLSQGLNSFSTKKRNKVSGEINFVMF